MSLVGWTILEYQALAPISCYSINPAGIYTTAKMAKPWPQSPRLECVLFAIPSFPALFTFYFDWDLS